MNLKVSWSGDGYDDVEQKDAFTVWDPDHFASELKTVVREVERIRARHVIRATVPHVTIAPVARGVGTKVRQGSRYFPYYTRPSISDEHFDPKDRPVHHGPGGPRDRQCHRPVQPEIVAAVGAARHRDRDWYVLDLASVLDRLASRRYREDLAARPEWWAPYELPSELRELSPPPDSEQPLRGGASMRGAVGAGTPHRGSRAPPGGAASGTLPACAIRWSPSVPRRPRG